MSIEQVVLLITGVPATVGLVNIFKQFVENEKFHPLLALVFGIALNLAGAYVLAERLDVAALSGLLTGMGAAGVYDLMPHATRPKAVKPPTAPPPYITRGLSLMD